MGNRPTVFDEGVLGCVVIDVFCGHSQPFGNILVISTTEEQNYLSEEQVGFRPGAGDTALVHISVRWSCPAIRASATSPWGSVCQWTLRSSVRSTSRTLPGRTASNHTASGIWRAIKICRSARPSISVKWMSGPASTTAVFTASAPRPGLPASPRAGARQALPMGDLRRRPPPRGISPLVHSGLKYVPATTVAGPFARPMSAPQPLICGSVVTTSPGMSQRSVSLAWRFPLLDNSSVFVLAYRWSVKRTIPRLAALLVFQQLLPCANAAS